MRTSRHVRPWVRARVKVKVRVRVRVRARVRVGVRVRVCGKYRYGDTISSGVLLQQKVGWNNKDGVILLYET